MTAKATLLAMGRKLRPLYDFTQAHVVLSLDCDFLGPGPAQETYSRDFMYFRKSSLNSDSRRSEYNRLYTIESSVSVTGACSDHRWPLCPTEIQKFMYALAMALGIPNISVGSEQIPLSNELHAIASDLKAHSGRCLIVVGEQQPVQVHALALLINEYLGNFGKSVRFVSPEENYSPPSGTLEELTRDIADGRVSALF